MPSLSLRVTYNRRNVKTIPVDSLPAASAWWCAAREAKGYRSSTMPRVEVLTEGLPTHHVSYNGKVWEGLEWRPGQQPVYDPADRRDRVHLAAPWDAVIGLKGPLCGAPASLDTTGALSLATCPACRAIAEAAREDVAAVSFPADLQSALPHGGR